MRYEDPIARIVSAVAAGHRTFRDVSAATGIPLTRVFETCETCRDLGLITWDTGRSGTLRTDLSIVAHTPQHR